MKKLADESTNPQLKKAFEMHRKETEGQVKRLEKCFKLLGESPEDTECAGIKGLIEEKESFMEEKPSPDILDVFHVGAAIKTESYEINEYESLTSMAREMQHTEVAQLLKQNLAEEKAALKKMEAFDKKIKPKRMMTEEQQDAGSSSSKRKRAA